MRVRNFAETNYAGDPREKGILCWEDSVLHDILDLRIIEKKKKKFGEPMEMECILLKYLIIILSILIVITEHLISNV